MIICTCNRVNSEVWSQSQCFDCWRLANVREFQNGTPTADIAARFPNLKIGTYRTVVEALAFGGGRMPPTFTAKATRLESRSLLNGFTDPLPLDTPIEGEAAHIAAFRSMLDSHPDYPGDNGQLGIVWTCHNPRFFTMTAIACRRLRKLGCNLPVEVWWRSSCGRVDVTGRTLAQMVEGYDITLVDRDEMALALGDTRLTFGDASQGGWQVKTYAATHTKLARFWLMDSDALFVRDPSSIIPDCPFGYWIDLLAWKSGRTNWEKYGLQDCSELVGQVQGGHMWFDKRRAWRLLCMVHQGNENHRYWYSHSNDDQSLFRGALAYGACPGYRTFGDLENGDWYRRTYGGENPSRVHAGEQGSWVQRGFVCQYDGEPLITHYCMGKVYAPELPRCDKIPGDRERLLEWLELAEESLGA